MVPAMPNYTGRAIAVLPDAVQVEVIVTVTNRRNGLRADSAATLCVAPGEDDGPLLNAERLTLRLPDGTEQDYLVANRSGGPGQLRLDLVASG